MNEDFKTVPLDCFADVVMGQSPDSARINSDEVGLPFLQGCAEFGRQSPQSNLYCSPPLRVAPSQSVLVSVRAPVGTSNWADQSYCIGRGLGAFKAKPGQADTHFLHYALEDNVAHLHRRSQGSTFSAIGGEDLKKFPVPDFDFPIQTKIARILQTIDEAIEQTEVLIEKYSLVKAGMMHDLFTRGLTPDGKLRPPREEAPDLYKETPIGWIPTDWDVDELKTCVRSVQYGISSSLTDEPTGIPVLRMNNIQENAFDVSDLKYANTIEARALRLSSGDILYNRTNSMQHVGKTAIWRDELPECSFASYLVRVNLDETKLDREYFAFWMSQVSSQNALRRYATPAVQQVNINPTNLQRVRISRPQNLDEQRNIVKRINAVVQKASIEREKLAKLRLQKMGLMRDLLSGEVPVKINDPEAAHV